MSVDEKTGLLDPDGPTSIRPRLLPTAVIVGCTPALTLACKEILASIAIGLEVCTVETYRDVLTRVWPPLLVIPEAVYAFDPEGFSEIAAALGTIIVRLERDEAPEDELRATLVAAATRAVPAVDGLQP